MKNLLQLVLFILGFTKKEPEGKVGQTLETLAEKDKGGWKRVFSIIGTLAVIGLTIVLSHFGFLTETDTSEIIKWAILGGLLGFIFGLGAWWGGFGRKKN